MNSLKIGIDRLCRKGWHNLPMTLKGLLSITAPPSSTRVDPGNPVFEVGGRKVRFNKLQAPGSGLIFYDVWWLSAKNERTGTPETWKLGQ